MILSYSDANEFGGTKIMLGVQGFLACNALAREALHSLITFNRTPT